MCFSGHAALRFRNLSVKTCRGPGETAERETTSFPPDIQRIALRKLAQLHAVTELNLTFPCQWETVSKPSPSSRWWACPATIRNSLNDN